MKLLMTTFLSACVVGCISNQYVREHNEQPLKQSTESIELPIRITAGNESNFSPSLSSNGKFVFFVTDRNGNKDIWRKRIGGGIGTVVTDHPADDFSPEISPDGKHLAFVSRRADASGDIHIMNLGISLSRITGNKENPNRQITLKKTEDLDPAWFPDSQKLVFSARYPGQAAPQLMIVDLDDLKPQPIEGVRGYQASVSPDGNWILYVSDANIFAYDLLKERIVPLTTDSEVINGQPSFSPDGREVFFSRYVEDSNGDGKFDGDDFAMIAKFNFADQIKASKKDNYSIQYLTNSELRGTSPHILDKKLYFSLQNKESLDIFSLPQYGQISPLVSKDTLFEWLEKNLGLREKLLVIRTLQYRAGSDDKLSINQLALMELRELVLANKFKEAKHSYKKINNVFKDRNTLDLVEIELLNLLLNPIAYPEYKGSIDRESQENLRKALKKVSGIVDASQDNEVYARGNLLVARIWATQKKFFEAESLLTKLTKNSDNGVASEAALYRAKISLSIVGLEETLLRFVRFIEANKYNKTIVRRASKFAVQLAVNSDRPQHFLQFLKDNSVSLPILPAETHSEIVTLFRNEGNEAVATNEMREIIHTYRDSPLIQIETLKNLLKIEENNSRYKMASKLLQFTKRHFLAHNPEYSVDIENIITSFNLRRGRTLLREAKYKQALEIFESILSYDDNNISAHRGKIDSFFKMGLIEEAFDFYKRRLENEESGPNYYYLGYAKTYFADLTTSRSERIATLKAALDNLIEARMLDSNIVELHQTLGWVNQQISFWTQKEIESGSWSADISNRWSIVQNFFGFGNQNWSQQSIDALLTAYYLSDDDSIGQSGVLQNLGNTYYTLKNYKKALFYYLKRIQLFNSIKAESREFEAIVFDRAGRSAFQIDELALAAKLQFQAATIWREVGSKENYARSLDALALSLRESKNYRDANEIYSQLLIVQKGLANKNNIANSYINRAWMEFRLSNIKRSLTDLDEALALLDSQGLEKNSTKKEEVISVNLASGSSAAKGFNVEERKLLVFGLKKLIFTNSRRNDLVLDQINLQFDTLQKIRNAGLDAGQSEQFKNEHLAINRNNSAILYKELGDIDTAVLKFIEAADISRKMRNSDQNYANSDEILNLGNAIALQLLGAESSEKNSRLQELEVRALTEIKPLEEIVAKGALSEVNSLLNLYFHLAKIKEYKGDYISSQKLLGQGYANIAKHNLQASNYAQSIYIAMQAYSLQLDESKNSIELSRKIRKEVFSNKYKTEQYVLAKSSEVDFEEQFLAIKSGAYLTSKVQFLNFRKVFLAALSRNLENAEKLFVLMSQYSFALNLSTLFPQDDFSERPNIATALLQVHDEIAQIDADFTFVVSLGKNEVLIVGQNYEGDAYKYTLNGFDAAAFNEIVSDEWGSDNKAQYVIPIGEAFNFVWNEVRALEGRNWSFTPSREFVGVAERNWNSGVLNVSVLHDQNGSYDSEIHEYRKESIPAIDEPYRNYFADLLVIGGRYEDFIHGGFNSRFVDDSSNGIGFSLQNLSNFDLAKTTTIVIPHRKKIDWNQNFVSTDDFSWIYLANAALSSGAANVLLYDSDRKFKLKDVLEIIEKKNVTEAALATKATRIGYAGMSLSEEWESMADEMEDLLESAEIAFDDGFFDEAIKEYQKLYIRSVKLQNTEMRNTALEGLVNSNYKAKKYIDAMRYKLRILANIQKNILENGNDSDYDVIDAGEALVDAAVLAVRGKNTELATKLLNQAQAIFEKEEDDMILGKIAHYRGINHENSGLYQETIKAYQTSFDKYEKTDPRKAAQRILDIANVYRNKVGNYAMALSKYEEARNLFNVIGSSGVEIKSIEIDRANTLMAMGEINKAIEILKNNVISKIDPQEDPWEYARANGILANAYYRGGDFEDAKDTNDIASKSAENIAIPGRKLTVSLDVLNLEAMILAKLGNYEESDAAFQKGMKIAEENSINWKLSLYYNNYGFWLRERGLIDESIRYFKMAYELDSKLNDTTAVAYDNRNMALSLIVKNDYIRARDMLEKSLSVSLENGLIYNAVYCYLGLGDISLKERNADEAYVAFKKASEMSKKTGMKDFEWRSLSGMGAANVALGNNSAAIRDFTSASIILEGLVSGLKTEDSKNGFHSDRGVQQLYRDLTLAHHAIGNTLESWQAANRSRKKYLLDKFSNRKQVGLVRNKETMATTTIDYVPLGELQKNLRSSDVFIDYFVTNQSLLIWTISKDSIESAKVDVSKGYLKQLIADYRDLLEKYSTTEYLGQEISQLLVQPIANNLKQNSRILIVATDILSYLSFAGLNWKDNFLVEDFEISYFDSAYHAISVLNSPQSSVDGSSSIIAFTNPERTDSSQLPFSTKEAMTFNRHFKKVKVLSGNLASVHNFQKNSPNYDIIHIGAHGKFDPLDPIDAKLLLAQNQNQQSDLRPLDILPISLNANLVTLSACNSGLGGILDGQKDLGLKAAFEMSGVKSIVTTLWRIDDVTSAVVMKRFYRYLSEGHNKAAALRKAQIVAKQYFTHPAYWASFRLSGDYR